MSYMCVFEDLEHGDYIDCFSKQKVVCPIRELCDCNNELAENILKTIKSCIDTSEKARSKYLDEMYT